MQVARTRLVAKRPVASLGGRRFWSDSQAALLAEDRNAAAVIQQVADLVAVLDRGPVAA